MYKYFFTYLLAIVLISSVVIPTFLSFNDVSCELSLEVDAEEESEKIKEIEIKMFAEIGEYFAHKHQEVRTTIVFYSKQYTSVYLNLDSPPPEAIA